MPALQCFSQRLDELRALISVDRGGGPLAPRARGASDAMHVLHRVLRALVLHHVRHVAQVQPARREAGAHERMHSAFAEGLEGRAPLRQREQLVEERAAFRVAAEFLVHLLCCVRRVGEDQLPARRTLLDREAQRLQPLRRLDLHEDLAELRLLAVHSLPPQPHGEREEPPHVHLRVPRAGVRHRRADDDELLRAARRRLPAGGARPRALRPRGLVVPVRRRLPQRALPLRRLLRVALELRDDLLDRVAAARGGLERAGEELVGLVEHEPAHPLGATPVPQHRRGSAD
mmetsp:Transcript_27679/g.58331  ORF Transcript_27679/g.58331 Transcript_27679/m.58331 type:complete len:288 (-) Transcript_27679:463-1326(-)